MKVFESNNPSELYLDIVKEVTEHGDKLAPRGKLIQEVRPATVEFVDPAQRVTFLKGRRINPFFQLAEALWIVMGRSDVEYLEKFNKNMKNFSDDGAYFNASYGERIRYHSKNAMRGVVLNPTDQLVDAFLKLKTDLDTRQAFIVISNPMFDNYKYSVEQEGKDVACNVAITFKVRDGALNMVVFNRSNDVHWGLFGANLAQFSTIQELIASWLNIEVGVYTYVTDSLYIYMKDYGFKETQTVLELNESTPPLLRFDTEPRMDMDYSQFYAMSKLLQNDLLPAILDDTVFASPEVAMNLAQAINSNEELPKYTDAYFIMTLNAMLAYRLFSNNHVITALQVINKFIPSCTWKTSMLNFLKAPIKNWKWQPDFYNTKEEQDLASKEYGMVVQLYNDMVEGLAITVHNKCEAPQFIRDYLEMPECLAELSPIVEKGDEEY